MKRPTHASMLARTSGVNVPEPPGMVCTTIAAPTSIGPWGVRVQLHTTPAPQSTSSSATPSATSRKRRTTRRLS
jgi:hypothetical protein